MKDAPTRQELLAEIATCETSIAYYARVANDKVVLLQQIELEHKTALSKLESKYLADKSRVLDAEKQVVKFELRAKTAKLQLKQAHHAPLLAKLAKLQARIKELEGLKDA